MESVNKELPHRSLSDVHSSIDPASKRTGWGKILAFFGPAYLVSVGYMDPGNWATDIAGGSRYGYTLIWVLLMSNIMAFILQSLSARLGLVRGKDLAQVSRETYPPLVNIFLYGLAEIAIAACDLAEVLGMAIGLNLLFHIPILYGVVITIGDTFLLLFLQRLGMRKMEMFIISLIAIIGLSFFVELILAKPDGMGILHGFKPSIPDRQALYITIGIIGATVMPHNLYLHSALVQTRKIEKDHGSVSRAIKLSTIDSGIALNFAFLVNASILILAAAAFHANGLREVADIMDAHKLLAPLLGTLAPILFAVALIASGQSSTITGTLAGQIIMEGYLHLRLPMWIRRLITRMLAVLPAFFVIYYFGESASGSLLVLSQVILSLQLGFAVIPLIHFISDKRKMGQFTIRTSTKVLAWLIAVVIIVFNVILVYQTLQEWFANMNPSITWLKIPLLTVTFFVAAVLVYITFEPFLRQRNKIYSLRLPHGVAKQLGDLTQPVYNTIAVTIDFSRHDYKAIEHAIGQGGKAAEYILIHIVETPNAMLSEQEVGDHEAGEDSAYLKEYVNMLSQKGYKARYEVGYGRRARAIAGIVNEEKAGLLVMASHGHKGLKDIFLGETINAVRHRVKVPLLAVK
jgi:manganese transport protein